MCLKYSWDNYGKSCKTYATTLSGTEFGKFGWNWDIIGISIENSCHPTHCDFRPNSGGFQLKNAGDRPTDLVIRFVPNFFEMAYPIDMEIRGELSY